MGTDLSLLLFWLKFRVIKDRGQSCPYGVFIVMVHAYSTSVSPMDVTPKSQFVNIIYSQWRWLCFHSTGSSVCHHSLQAPCTRTEWTGHATTSGSSNWSTTTCKGNSKISVLVHIVTLPIVLLYSWFSLTCLNVTNAFPSTILKVLAT